MDILLTASAIVAMSYISDYFEFPSTFIHALNGWIKSKSKDSISQDDLL